MFDGRRDIKGHSSFIFLGDFSRRAEDTKEYRSPNYGNIIESNIEYLQRQGIAFSLRLTYITQLGSHQ